jgi:hypothetical protein
MHPSSPRSQREGDSVANPAAPSVPAFGKMGWRSGRSGAPAPRKARAWRKAPTAFELQSGCHPERSAAINLPSGERPSSARSRRTPRSRMHRSTLRSRREGESVAQRPTKITAVHQPLAARGLGAQHQPLLPCIALENDLRPRKKSLSYQGTTSVVPKKRREAPSSLPQARRWSSPERNRHISPFAQRSSEVCCSQTKIGGAKSKTCFLRMSS